MQPIAMNFLNSLTSGVEWKEGSINIKVYNVKGDWVKDCVGGRGGEGRYVMWRTAGIDGKSVCRKVPGGAAWRFSAG